MFLILALGALVLGYGVLVRARTGTPGAVPTGTGSIPAGSGMPTAAAGQADPSTTTLASTLNASLHMQGSGASNNLLVQFQSAAGLPPTGVYDTATARALAAYVSNPPLPDYP